MATLDDIGIQSIATALVETFQLKKSVQVSTPTLTEIGEFHRADAYKVMFEFNAKGAGDLPAAFVLGSTGGAPSLAIVGVTGGKTIILGAKEADTNKGTNTWEMNGKNYPAAA